jgi:pyridoxamine 5'-phosphate oxidase-like protein
MSELAIVAPAFVTMAHRIVWCTAATVDSQGRPRSRILHPYWIWDGDALVGWIATGPTPVKRAHLAHSPYVSLNYCTARPPSATTPPSSPRGRTGRRRMRSPRCGSTRGDCA